MISLDTPRKGDWMQTFTQVKFWPLDPRSEDVDIADIAHALSMQCRFAGHTPFHYSVAQHSLYVAQHCPHGMEIIGLLHDAPEAYLVDLPRPIKTQIASYADFEWKIWIAISMKFDIPLDIPSEVKLIDEMMLSAERTQLMPSKIEWTTDKVKPIPIPITKMYPEEVEALFLDTFFKLMGRHK